MTESPLVSVIVPVYNGEAYLAEALESVFAQDYAPLEVIVADDGSTDASLEIARSFSGVACLELAHEGVSAARNAAVRASTGDWLAFLDADDTWLPGKMTAQVRAGGAPCGLVLCHSVFQFEGAVPGWFLGPLEGSAVPSFAPSAWLIRRKTFDAVGPFDEARSVGEDTEWLSRAWDQGVQYLMLDEPLLRRRIHASNATGRILKPRRILMDILRESVGRKHAGIEAE